MCGVVDGVRHTCKTSRVVGEHQLPPPPNPLDACGYRYGWWNQAGGFLIEYGKTFAWHRNSLWQFSVRFPVMVSLKLIIYQQLSALTRQTDSWLLLYIQSTKGNQTLNRYLCISNYVSYMKRTGLVGSMCEYD